MGLFEKLFGKQSSHPLPGNNNDEIPKSAEMLDEDLFWLIIAKSLKSTSNQSDQEKYLVREIEKLTPVQMIGFKIRTDKLLQDTYNAEMWCAAYIMNGGCSDDMFDYFRNWVISRGKEVYYLAKSNPDSLIVVVNQDAEDYEFESFHYVAVDAFSNKTGKDLYDFVDNEEFRAREGKRPEIDFNWEEDEPESMRKICPKLFDKLWNA